MGCLFCGKEIGPFRLLRDDEFCSAIHRKQYKDRLGKALTKIGAPEPPPAPMADFLNPYPIQTGNVSYTTVLWDFNHRVEAVEYRRAIPVTIGPVAGGIPLPMAGPSPSDSPRHTSMLPPEFNLGQVHLPAPLAGIAGDVAADVAAKKEDELLVTNAAGALPLEAAAAETMVFAIENVTPVAGPVPMIAPALPAPPYAPLLSRAEQARPLQVTTAPVSAKCAMPAASLASPAPAEVRLPRFEVTAVEACVEPIAVPAPW